MKNKLLYKLLTCVILVSIMTTFISVSVTANQEDVAKTKIKIGYMGFGSDRGVFSEKSTQPISAYNNHYLEEIAKHTNWEYEFVYGSLSECLERLETGEIDLFGPLQYSEERGEVFDYPELEFGYEYACLYAYSQNTDYYFEDFENFSGMTVGLIEENYNNEIFDTYCSDNGFTVEKVYFDEDTQLVEALEIGKIDAIVSGRLSSTNIVKELGSFGFEKYYYATTKGNSDITNELSEALKEIRVNDPLFDVRAYDKYYTSTSEIDDIRMTRDEADYIKNNPTVNASSYANWLTISSRIDSESRGIAIDIVDYMADTIGVEFNHLDTPSFEYSMELYNTNKTDVMIVSSDIVIPDDMILSKPFLDLSTVLISKSSSIPKNNPRIAIPINRHLDNIIEVLPEGAKVIDCLDYASCFDAVNRGEADATIIDSHSGEYLTSSKINGDMYIVDALNTGTYITLGVRDNCNPALLSLINKTIDQLDPIDIEGIILSNKSKENHSTKFTANISTFMSIIIGFFVLLIMIVLIVSFIYRRKARIKSKLTKFTDDVIGGANFTKFQLDATELFTKFSRNSFSLVYFDVNRFKYINDKFGYKIGDDILCHVSRCANDVLYDYELCARVSADNFVLLLKNTNIKQITTIIKKLSREIQSHNQAIEGGHKITLSYGVYFLLNENEDFYTMLDKANVARKTIKCGYETAYAFYDDKMFNALAHEMRLNEAMKPALLNNEFKLYLQPKHCIKTNKIIGAEALVRWESPENGLITPDDFIPFMEHTGFITQIDFCIFEEVCKLIRYSLDNNIPVYRVSVNLSRTHMQSRDFIHVLNDIVQKYSIPMEYLELELTETMVLLNQQEALAIMHILKKLGFHLSLDDFGTGYSSLNLLMEMPVDVLKLDKSFLKDVIATEREKTIINDIVSMAHHLNLCVVCEGVETQEQLDLLHDISCDIAQGYFFSKPIPIEDYYKYIS